ncbi:MAG: FtsW/RodA/SpoVE family cell cycle protein [Bacilli bacterium]|nr:FtsW/RodA/SpoVE family cell cycle protein [Bacilli bacterium]
MFISFLNMYNAKVLALNYQNHLIKQIIWYILGFLIMFIISKIDLKSIFKYSFIFYLGSIILLILVLIFGEEINGAKAWFNLKYFSFQPSELAKLSLALYLTKIVANTKIEKTKDEFILILKVLLITFIPSILVFLEPDTGAIIIYLLIAGSILLTSKIRKRWFIIISLITMIFLLIFFYYYFNNPDVLIKLIGTSFFYRVERLLSFTNGIGLQLENALVAIGSASFFGSGIGKVSIYIPEAPTDFIVAFTIENFGLITIFLILLAYLIIDIFLLKTYFNTNNSYKYFFISFIAIFYFQQFENILMNIGLMPIIGIPLPFLSYGGTTILIYFMFIGIILKFKKQKDLSFCYL